MRRIRIAAVFATVFVGVLGIAVDGMAQAMQFPVDRDAGINGFIGEHWSNFGASPLVRGSKGNQHGTIYDWSRETKDEILELIAGIEGPVEVTFSIFPVANSGGPPGSDLGLETIESKEDWEEGDDPQTGCCGQTGWTPGTFAMTHQYAQTFLDENGVVDELQSIPWVNDEDDTEFVIMNRGDCPPNCSIPNAVNTGVFSLEDYVEEDAWTIVLDDDFVDHLLNDEFNVGVKLIGREQHSNWKVYMRENGPDTAPFLTVGPKVCSSVRTIAPSFYLPGDVVTVTIAYRNAAPGTTIADTFPAGWDVADPGDGTVAGGTISFTTGDEPEGVVTYEVAAPPSACDTVDFSGTLSGDPIAEGGLACDSDIGGESQAQCIGTGGILIREDTWHDYTDLNFVAEAPSGVAPSVVETDDGLASLHMPSTDDDMYAIYVVNVTQLPAGKSTFPVAVTARNAGTTAAALGIRNLSIDDAPPAEQQAYLALYLDGGGAGIAQDESANQDPIGSIGDIPREDTTTTDTRLSEFGQAKTELAQVELRLGENRLRIDGTDPNVLPGYIPQTGAQLFHLVIGPGEPDLKGEVVVACNVKRRVPAYYYTNEPLEVTLEVSGVAGATTITETYPAGFQVTDPGGGTNDAGSHTLTFNVTAGADISYSLTPAGCGDAEFSGAFTGAGDFCDGDIIGDAVSVCAGTRTDFKVSQNGDGVQVWFEAEDYTERWDSVGVEVRGVDEPVEPHEFFPVIDARGAFNQVVTRAGGAGGRITYEFDISEGGGFGGTWYFWGRIYNPASREDHLLVEGDPGDADIQEPPPPFAAGNDDGDDRIFNQTIGPGWGWTDLLHSEGHTKVLQDGENTMHIIHDAGDNRILWDVFMWTDDPNYEPTDDDYLAASSESGGAVAFIRGDANADGAVNISDGSFILNALFAGGDNPTCADSGDANSDGGMNIADGVYILNSLFGGGAPPGPPYPDCGTAEPVLGCFSFAACQ